MFVSSVDLNAYNSDRIQFYKSLCEQLAGLLSVERDAVTNMAQTAAFIYQSIPDLNWAGFYINVKDKGLRLGPFQGKVACVHIPIGKGVCGTVAQTRTSIRVDDVHQFDGHIACDSASNSEIVVPIIVNEELFGVLDIDSPVKQRFSDEDLHGFEKLVATFVAATEFND
jgi:GAF domain-containing protein